MSYPNRRGQTQNNGSFNTYGEGSQMDYSERTPMSSSGRQSYYSSDGYSQYSGGQSQYSGFDNGMDCSNHTPYSQGGYSRGACYTEGGHTQGEYTTGGHTQGEYTIGGHTQGEYTEGGHTQGAYTEGGHTRDGYSQDGYSQDGYSRSSFSQVNSSERTPQSYYTEGGYTVNDSDRTPYSNYSGGDGNQGNQTYTRRASNESMSQYSVGSARRRASNESMSQYSTSQSQYASNDNSSYCASNGGTTVAGGGRGRCPYRVDFQVQNQGKQISSTKRSIYFRYGFAHEKALSQGKTGTECRGDEHDIVITWSITGGKRSISMDGREIQYSAGKRANASRRADVLEAAWRLSDHIYELKCYAYKPAAGSPEKRNPKWRQYSLIIDGRSFFELPQIFDLGVKGLRQVLPVEHAQIVNKEVNSSTISSIAPNSIAPINEPPPNQVKNAIQSRIDQQRKLMKARKQAVSDQKKESSSEHEQAKAYTSLNSDLLGMGLESSEVGSAGGYSNSTGVESSEVYSVANESTGVYSAAPSELGEAKSREEAALAPRPAPDTPQYSTTHAQQLTQHTGTQGNRSGGIPGRPTPHQRQIQAQQHQSQQHQNRQIAQMKPKQNTRTNNHHLQHYQIEDRQSELSASTTSGTSTSASSAHPANHPHGTRMVQRQPHVPTSHHSASTATSTSASGTRPANNPQGARMVQRQPNVSTTPAATSGVHPVNHPNGTRMVQRQPQMPTSYHSASPTTAISTSASGAHPANNPQGARMVQRQPNVSTTPAATSGVHPANHPNGTRAVQRQPNVSTTPAATSGARPAHNPQGAHMVQRQPNVSTTPAATSGARPAHNPQGARMIQSQPENVPTSHHSNLTKTSLSTAAISNATSGARPAHNLQGARMAQRQHENVPPSHHSPPTQQNGAYRQQIQQSNELVFAPQQPPTYDEITRDVQGAYDAGSAVTSITGAESSIVPRDGGTYDDYSVADYSVATSNAGESSIVSREGRTYDDNSVRPSTEGESAMVSRPPNGFGFSGRNAASNSGDSVSANSAMSTSYASPNLSTTYEDVPSKRTLPRSSSSVDPRGVNKWGYF